MPILIRIAVKARNFLDRTILKNKPRAWKIGNTVLSFPREHLLPVILKKHPEYAQNIVRLSKAVYEKYPDLKVIDVGGNVGDTSSFIRSSCPSSPIASIDGDEKFFSFLEKNALAVENVSVFKMFLGDKEGDFSAEMKNENGTMKIFSEKTGENKIKISTLDKFVKENPKWKNAKLLKIDADGFDFKIIRGGKDYLRTAKPVIFFEYARSEFEHLGEKGLDTMETLFNLGYEKIVYYDNYGRFLLSADLADKKLISELNYYTPGKSYGRTFPYYDVAVFHKEDSALFENFSRKEMERNRET